MGRDRFTKIEWGDQRNTKGVRDFGYCDHGLLLQTREEAEVYAALKAQGYTVHKHGWPDFMAVRDADVRLIEVKSSADFLRENQKAVNAGLLRLGARVETIVIDNPNRPRRIGYRPTPLRKRKVGS